jgi:serine/threonine protein kinase
MMADILKEARRAARKRDYSRAGDLFDLAGHPKEAIEMYLHGRHYLLAANLAVRMGDPGAAAGYFASGGDMVQAGEYFLKAGQRRKAAMMYERSGQFLKAAEIEERMGNLLAAAAHYERADQVEKAAYLYAQVGDTLKAAGLYERLLKSSGAGDAATSGAFALEDSRKRRARYSRFSGILHFKAGLFDKAAPRLEEAGMFEQAVEAYRRAGDTAHAAELLVKLENYAEALRIVEEDSDTRIDGRLLGELLLRSGQFARAAETFLAEKLPYKAAECFESAGDLARAAELFAAEGEHIRAADLFKAIGRHADAAHAYEAGAEHVNAAAAYVTAGLTPRAVSALIKAKKPTAAAELLLKSGEEDDGIRLLQKVKPGEPEYRRACFLLGKIFAAGQLHSLAFEKFEIALKHAVNETEMAQALYQIGLAFEQMGRIDEARKAYERVLSIDYHHEDVAFRLKQIPARLAASGLGTAGAPPAPGDATPRGMPVVTVQGPAQSASTRPGGAAARLDLIRSLGPGRHGEVYEAYDRALHRQVAVRRFPPSPGRPDLFGRLIQEAGRARELVHPNVVNVFGTIEDEQGRYVIMELIEGRPLRALLNEKVRLDPARILSYAQQIAEVLDFAHRKGVLHRDLRPENVFIVGQETAKLGDFGIKARASDGIEQGSLEVCYVAPEHLKGERVDARSDIYSLGIMLYEMLIGEPPFPAETASFDHLNTPPTFPQKVDRVVPAFLKKIIFKCLMKDPARRYRSASALVDDFKASGIVPGVMVAERYEIIREVGIGGMGRVYQAIDRDLDEVVALKVLRGADAEEKQVERFLRELKLARRIAHPNVVKVFDLGSWRDHRYISMEFVDGVNLEQWRRLQPSLDVARAVRMMSDVARALGTAHAIGIVHRDIKPQNILVQAGDLPKVLDFGIARSGSGDKDLTTQGFVMGSPKYMSPEQVQALPIDARTDIYSLGVVMYFLFTGREPFVGESATGIAHRQIHEKPRPPQELNGSLPEWLNHVILKALEKRPERRFDTMEEMASTLEAGLSQPVGV